ncbi:alpha,alpha-trehalose-phosphate synthase (UDP-forming) [Halomarina litorea]|uniref:alpha,alpha-trehalose-phosphate synthase (UDP-forming) n=1 Tax=Halomarina litorea TaxID=2961595 RepID=UPI0020C59CDE|nr:trehalose-6-phosphate synthase [Halomarina sp. BCD28]
MRGPEVGGREAEAARPPTLDGLTVVSNRQPYRHDYEDGEGERDRVVVDRPAGGLTAGLDPVMRHAGGTWVAWGDGDADREVVDDGDRVGVPPEDPAYTLRRLWLTDDEVAGYYRGYANQALWPLCHAATGKMTFDAADWRDYRAVNRTFADAVVEESGSDPRVWFQDYHFALAPRMVRERRPDASLMQFWHIPWPAPDVFRTCPQRRDVLAGLLANDLLGFHTERYRDNFLDCVDAELDDAVVARGRNRVRYDGHVTTVGAFPMGVDAEDIERRAAAATGEFWERFRREHGIAPETTVALGVDRLDYTKGIPRRLAGLEKLWELRPEWRGEVTYVQKGSESRSSIPAYARHQEEVFDAIDRVNDRFGTDEWTPVVYTDELYSEDELAALYRHSDVGLVTPVRDGMNLVAKEYVAAQVDDDGVLVLSDLAGATEGFADRGVLTTTPFDPESLAASLETALTMPADERRRRMRSLRRQVREHDIYDWMESFLGAAECASTS